MEPPFDILPVITEVDWRRLQGLLSTRAARTDPTTARRLTYKLQRARIVPATEIAPSIMTMSSRASCWNGETCMRRDLTLVWPWNEARARGLVSVLSPLGIQLLAAVPGQTIIDQDVSWRLVEVVYQPEAEGDFHLLDATHR
jgi:regulator of nucleoside diphosphate kinase